MDVPMVILIAVLIFLSFLEYKKRNIRGYHVTGTCTDCHYIRGGRVYSGTYTYQASGQMYQGTTTSIGRKPKIGKQYDLIVDENDPTYIVRNSDKNMWLVLLAVMVLATALNFLTDQLRHGF